MPDYTIEQLKEAIANSDSKSDVCRQLQIPINGTYFRRLLRDIQEYNLDISHFTLYRDRTKYPKIQKICPVCGREFVALLGHPKEKRVCKRACSNTYFRSGSNNGNWKPLEERRTPCYRDICFQTKQPRCMICGWDIVVDVHHFDENEENNNPDNLFPLCPNHHKMIHMNKYKQQLRKQLKSECRP